MDRADVVIAGAGPAGAALAIRLARAGARVVLLDDRAADPAFWPDVPGERLGADAALICDPLGLSLDGIALPEASVVRLWSGARPDTGAAARPGLLLSRRDLDAALVGLARRAGASVWSGTAFAGITEDPGAWHIRTRARDGEAASIAAPLIVDATGRRAAVARALGQVPPVRADAMTAILRWSTGPSGPPVFAVEALPGGWSYAATLPRGRAVAGLILPRSAWSGRPGPVWDRLLVGTQIIGALLRDHAGTWGPPAVLPAAPALAPCALGPGWALIGDAARQADPIAGRGVLHAILSAALLAEVILAPAGQAAGAAARYTGWLTAVHADHMADRAAAYAASDRLGPLVHAALAAPALAGLALA